MDMGEPPILARSAEDMPPPPAVSEGRHISRPTKSGQTIWYNLKVIQQPERARACGSGPKSSADRRPVDPPPVVELRIFAGATWEQARERDITFLYNANFFLIATLEDARVTAQGPGQTPAGNPQQSALTGAPVSSMSYLDRPREAGYFLFPDISVRQEGLFRLNFHLYEETKEDKDKDPESVDGQLSAAAGGSFDFRMMIKSNDFVVYSAKKFPGLTESTALSRMVAEQGCRVRIRRDVRMRRRDPKGTNVGGNKHNAGAIVGDCGNSSRREHSEDEYGRQRTSTSDSVRADPFRGSMSGSTDRSPYSADSQPRPSLVDYPPSLYPPQHPPQPPSAGGHLQFLSGSTSSQYPAQPQPYQRPPPVPASSLYPPYPPVMGPPYPARASYHSLPPPPPPASALYGANRTSQGYTPPMADPRRRDSILDHEYRGPVPFPGGVTLPPLILPHAHVYHQHIAPAPSHLPLTPHKSPRTLPPLQFDSRVTASGRLPMLSPSLTAPRTCASNSSSAASTFSRSMPPPMPPPYAGKKRAHEETFREAYEPRYQNGARSSGVVEDKDDGPMMYKRADGTVKEATPDDYAGLYYYPRR